jgi:hypothetical protein
MRTKTITNLCRSVVLFLFAIFSLQSTAQNMQQNTPPGPQVLPGKGAKEFNFLYAGEGKYHRIYIVRGGQITWSYVDTTSRGEISDAVLMTNGNVLFAHQFGITLLSPDKKVLWNYDTPKNHETHTAQPIGNDHVVFVQNGDTAKLYVMNIHTNKVEREIVLPVKNPKNVHPQFRHARLTKAGTILIAHMDLGKVCEYDVNGKELLSIDVPSVWSAEELKNGNILTASNHNLVQEFTHTGTLVWQCHLSDIAGYKLTSPQIATRLPNGNTLVNNWVSPAKGNTDPNTAPIQAVELTPDQKVVWALRAWADPLNLGPSTVIQVLNERGSLTEKVHFGNFK